MCDKRTQGLPRERHRGANPRPSDYKSVTLPLSYEGRAGEYPEKPADKGHRPTRFPLAKILEWPGLMSDTVFTSVGDKQSNLSATVAPRPFKKRALKCGTNIHEVTREHLASSGVGWPIPSRMVAGSCPGASDTRQILSSIVALGILKRDMEQLRNWEIPEKTRRPVASSGMIPTCENPGVTPSVIELGLAWEQ
ncbi:hypothetical protein PR048_016647 [Dryococelus australis]|uniref:Prolactin receptor n=1 Tax=Dryococelus australis TaxID=614101 RepID=A0ABQ9H7C2_9NEOP|nr:hypothetical protein PR048_016647 [Dryococelus australis]